MFSLLPFDKKKRWKWSPLDLPKVLRRHRGSRAGIALHLSLTVRDTHGEIVLDLCENTGTYRSYSSLWYHSSADSIFLCLFYPIFWERFESRSGFSHFISMFNGWRIGCAVGAHQHVASLGISSFDMASCPQFLQPETPRSFTDFGSGLQM